MPEISLLGLRVVRDVARQGSFSAAADRLGYTQSAVSRQVALVERATGKALFERHARGVRLTRAGGVVVRHAEAVLAELDAVREELSDIGERPSGRLRVGGFSTALAALVPRAIAVFAVRNPEVTVVLREGLSASLVTAVARQRLDLAIVAPPASTAEGVRLSPLLDDPLLVAVARDHALAGQTSVTPDRLVHERWIAGSADPATSLLGAWAGPGWRPQIAYVAKDWTAKLGLVAAGCGVTVVPGLAAPALPDAVAVVRIDDPAAVRVTAIAIPADPHESVIAAKAFSEAVLDVAAELAHELRRDLWT